MFTMLRGLGATLSRALCQLALDRNADAFEEIRPPTLVTTRHAHRDGPAAEVRRRRLRHRARRPVVHPDRRGAAHLDRARRDARRGRAAGAVHGVHAVLPARGRIGRAATRVGCCAATSSTRSRSSPTPRRRRRRRCSTSCSLGRVATIARSVCLPHPRHLHRRPRPEPPPQLRHRGVRAGRRPVAGGQSVSWFSDYQARRANIRYRPTGAKGTEPLHTLNGSALAVPRVLAGHPRDLPPARRLGGHPRGAVAVHAAPGDPLTVSRAGAAAVRRPAERAPLDSSGASQRRRGATTAVKPLASATPWPRRPRPSCRPRSRPSASPGRRCRAWR